jgi:hypothetical protein
MPDATVDDANAAALDRQCRAEIAAAAREGVPLGNHVAVRRTLAITADVRATADGGLAFERVRAVKAVG